MSHRFKVRFDAVFHRKETIKQEMLWKDTHLQAFFHLLLTNWSKEHSL